MILNRAKGYYENDKKRLIEHAKNKYKNLSEEKKNKKKKKNMEKTDIIICLEEKNKD